MWNALPVPFVKSTVSVDMDKQQQNKIDLFHALVTCPSRRCPLFKCLHCNSNFSVNCLKDKREIEKHVDECYAAFVHAAELEITARMTTTVEEPDEELDFGSGDGYSFVDQEETNKRYRSIIRRACLYLLLL